MKKYLASLWVFCTCCVAPHIGTYSVRPAVYKRVVLPAAKSSAVKIMREKQSLYIQPIAPDDILIVPEERQLKHSTGPVLVVYTQSRRGVSQWSEVAYFPVISVGRKVYPYIQRVVKPKPDSIVIHIELAKDVTVTRSYCFNSTHSKWTLL